MSEGPAQQRPQDPRPDASEGGREVLEGRIIPSRSQAQRQYDAHQPRHAAPDDPRQQFAAPAGPGSGAVQAPAAGPAWDPQPPQAEQAQVPEHIPAQVQQAPVQQAAAPQPYADQPPVHHTPAAQQAQPPQVPQTPQGQPYAQMPPQAPVPPQQGYMATPQGYAPQQALQTPQSPQHALGGNAGAQPVPPPAPQPQGTITPAHQAQIPLTQPAQEPQPSESQPPAQPQTRSFGAKAAAFQERVQRLREAAAAEAADTAAETSRPRAAVPPPGGPTGPSSRSSSAAPPPAPGTPDWNALAEQQAASGARRRRVMMLTGGGVAVAVIAGVVATAVVMSGSSDDTAAASSSASSGTSQQPLPPEPSFSSVAPPPPPNPLDYLGTAAKDTAPLTPDTLFPGDQFLMSGRVYVKTASTSTTQCATGARSALATGLSANGCTKLIRATYTSGTMAVTVGVAVFPDTAHALKVQKTAQYLAPLNGGGVTDFCHAVACQMTSNAVGRYAYFAIAGLANGQTLSATDKLGAQAANDASDFAFQQIIQRGRDEAAADPTRQ